MHSNARREAALKLLAATGMDRSHYEPPLFRILWDLGINIPPPHFASFRASAIVTGVPFAILWGSCVWLLFLRAENASLLTVLILAVLPATVFGSAVASHYAWAARKYRLPTWEGLPAANSGESFASTTHGPFVETALVASQQDSKTEPATKADAS